MIYFPPPNIEYTPNIDIDLGSIRTATTGSTDANQLFCEIAPGNIGDRIIVFFHAKYPSSTVFISVEGGGSFEGMGGSGYAPTTGSIVVTGRISNGAEKRVRAYTENQGVVSSISILTLRVRGNLSGLVQGSYYSDTDTALSGAPISSVLNQNPFIKNYIYFSVLGGLTSTPYTSSDLPTTAIPHTLLGVTNTANTSMVIGYSKSTDNTLNLNASWAATSGNRMACITYLQADQRALGDIQGFNTSAVSQPSTNPHFLMIYPHFAKKAAGYEEVYEFTFRAGNYTGTPDGVVEIGLYDITDGYTNAILRASGSANKIARLSINKIPITPYKLTAGRSYALGYRTSITNNSPSQTFLVYAAYAGNFALRRSTLLGNSALSQKWSDAGLTSDSRLAIGASVRYTPAKQDNKIISNPAFIKKLNRAPDYPLLDTSNKITRGLSILYVPSAGPVNVVTKQRTVGGTNRRRGAAGGLALNDSRIDLPYPNGAPTLSKEITILAVAAASNSFDTALGIYDSTTLGNDTVSLCRSNLTGAWQNQWNSGARVIRGSFSSDGFWEAGKVVVGVTARKNSGVNQFHRYYKNGKFFSDGSAAVAHDNNASNSVRIGEQQGGGNRMPYLYLLAVWGRALTDVELASISLNPYQILVPNIGNYYSEESLVNDYSINTVDIDNIILAEQTQAILTGKNMAITNSARVRYGTKTLEMQNYTPAFTATFNVPPLTDFFSSGMPLGPVTFDVLKKE